MKSRPYLLPAALIVTLAVPAVGVAQQAAPQPWVTGVGAHRRHHGGWIRRFRGANLSDQQKQQITQLISQYRQAHPAGSAPDPEARKALRTSIKNVLTPAQQTQLRANASMMRERGTSTPQPVPAASPQ